MDEAGRITGKDLSGPPPEIRGLSVRDRMGSESAPTKELEPDDEAEVDFAFDEETGRISVKKAVGSDAEGAGDQDEEAAASPLAPAEESSGTRPVTSDEPPSARSPSPVAPQDLLVGIEPVGVAT